MFSSNADSELDALYDKMNHVTLDDVLNGNEMTFFKLFAFISTLQFWDENDHILKSKLCVSGAGRERKTSNMLRNITLDDVVGKMHSFHWKLMSSKNHHDQRELIYLNE